MNFPTSGVLVIGRIDCFGEGVRLTTSEPAPSVPLDARWPCCPSNVDGNRIIKSQLSIASSECFMSTGLPNAAGLAVNATCLNIPFLIEIPVIFQTPSGLITVPTVVAMSPPRGGGDRRPKDGTPRTNTAQNKQFADAVRQAEKNIGRKFGLDEIRQLHEDISGEDLSFWEIVQRAVEMFGN